MDYKKSDTTTSHFQNPVCLPQRSPPSLSPEHSPLCPGVVLHPASCPVPHFISPGLTWWPGKTTLQETPWGDRPASPEQVVCGCPPVLSQELGMRQDEVRVGDSQVGQCPGHGFPHTNSCSSRTILLSVISLLQQTTPSPCVDASVMYRKWKGKARTASTDIIR